MAKLNQNDIKNAATAARASTRKSWEKKYAKLEDKHKRAKIRDAKKAAEEKALALHLVGSATAPLFAGASGLAASEISTRIAPWADARDVVAQAEGKKRDLLGMLAKGAPAVVAVGIGFIPARPAQAAADGYVGYTAGKMRDLRRATDQLNSAAQTSETETETTDAALHGSPGGKVDKHALALECARNLDLGEMVEDDDFGEMVEDDDFGEMVEDDDFGQAELDGYGNDPLGTWDHRV